MSQEDVSATADEVLALAAVARQATEQGRLDDARTLLEGLVVLEPESAYLHTCLGCVYMRQSRGEEALEAFESALGCDPKDIVAHTFAGELRLDRGETATALSHFDAAIRLDPEGKHAHANRARALRLLASSPAREAAAARGLSHA